MELHVIKIDSMLFDLRAQSQEDTRVRLCVTGSRICGPGWTNPTAGLMRVKVTTVNVIKWHPSQQCAWDISPLFFGR